jgi:hypothetical protein
MSVRLSPNDTMDVILSLGDWSPSPPPPHAASSAEVHRPMARVLKYRIERLQ